MSRMEISHRNFHQNWIPACAGMTEGAYFMVGITNSEPIFLLVEGQRDVVVFRRV